MIRKRIIKYLGYKGITKYKFYKETGLSNGFLDKEGAIGSDKCEKISYVFPDINLEWLITGSGDMLKNSDIIGDNRDSPLMETKDYNEGYWRGRYDELLEKHKELLEEVAHIKSSSTTPSGPDASSMA